MKRNIVRRFTVLIALGLLVITVVGCSTVPVTGRRSLNLVSESQEMQLGLSSFDELKKETPISRDPALNELVQRVGKRIATVAGKDMPNAQWEFVVFESKEANAFCLPGGKVGVYTGLLPITQDEAGLATVMGHEIAHAVARHGAERMSEAMVLQTGGQVIGATMANSQYQGALMTAYGLGAKVGRELPHSRKQELEADNIGLTYMARAGYDPAAAIGFWQRFSDYNKQRGGSQPMSFLSTHPVDEVRIKQLQELLPKAQQEFVRSPVAK